MMRRIYITLIALALVSVTGCSGTGVSKGGYYWGGYSSSYYDLLKNPTDEQLQERVSTLEDIVQQSHGKGLRVPPGVHAELASAYMKQGLGEQAKENFRIEISLYPESEMFIRRLVDDL
jgi:hypothetical protein